MIEIVLIAKSADSSLLYKMEPTPGAPVEAFQTCDKSKELLKTIASKRERLSVEMANDHVFK